MNKEWEKQSNVIGHFIYNNITGSTPEETESCVAQESHWPKNKTQRAM